MRCARPPALIAVPANSWLLSEEKQRVQARGVSVQVTPLFASTARPLGGLGLAPAQLAVPLAISGAALVVSAFGRACCTRWAQNESGRHSCTALFPVPGNSRAVHHLTPSTATQHHTRCMPWGEARAARAGSRQWRASRARWARAGRACGWRRRWQPAWPCRRCCRAPGRRRPCWPSY